jgi:hypothetical protein
MHATSLLATPRFSACFFGGRWGVGVVVCYFLPLCGSVWGLLLLLLSRALGVLALYLASLCHITEKNSGYARGPLPVKEIEIAILLLLEPWIEIAIYYDRWEGEGSLCSLQDADRNFPSFPIDKTPKRLERVEGWSMLICVVRGVLPPLGIYGR